MWDLPLTDCGNADRLIRLYGSSLRYAPGVGWLEWSGRSWLPGSVFGSVRAMVDVMDGKATSKARKNWARQSGMLPRIKAAGSIAAQCESIVVSVDDLDCKPWLLPVANGTLDLRTGKLGPHRLEHLMTRCLGTRFEPEATAPSWALVLERVTQGNAELAKFLQRAMGYSLTGSTREQCLFICFGTGANGKSTVINTIREMLEGFGSQADPQTFLKRSRETISNDVARLRGARFVAACEPNRGMEWNEAIVKTMTGGDMLVARFMRREFFEFTPRFKLWLSCNRMPNFEQDDAAMHRRLVLVPFLAKVPRDRPDIVSELAEEREGILAWAVAGAVAWWKEGLNPPKVDVNVGKYGAVAEFVTECCEVVAGSELQFPELWDSYLEWCSLVKRTAVSRQAFGKGLRRSAPSYRHASTGTRYGGLRLRG